ncbi:hypothetical protein [Streptomyces sp. NPDC008137]|uniref:hypothetical protein n=1 Tax=Streptomyces sp. NPDC008137 TaxID=3364813 RepID=UPI0036E86EA5
MPDPPPVADIPSPVGEPAAPAVDTWEPPDVWEPPEQAKAPDPPQQPDPGDKAALDARDEAQRVEQQLGAAAGQGATAANELAAAAQADRAVIEANATEDLLQRQRLDDQAADPARRLDLEVDRAFTEWDQNGTAEQSAYETTQRLAKGLAGEKAAAEALASQGYDVLYYKPDIAGTNQGGIDIVVQKDGQLYLVDNKALEGWRNVSSVSALDKNLTANTQSMAELFDTYANDPARPAVEQEMYGAAAEKLRSGGYEKVVTNANLAAVSGFPQDVSGRLDELGFQMWDLMGKASPHDPDGGAAEPGTRQF